MGAAVVLPYFLAIEVCFRIEVLYLAGKPRLEFRRIESGDRTGTIDAGQQVVPVIIHRIAYWCQRTKPGNDNSP